MFFNFIPLPMVLTFQIISITQVRANERKTNLTRPLKLLTITFPTCMIWSLVPHVKHPPPQKFRQKDLFPRAKLFFTKKVTPYFVGEEETLCFILTSFSIPKSFIPNFCGINYDLSSKIPSHCFSNHILWFWNCPNYFIKSELQNNIAKN